MLPRQSQTATLVAAVRPLGAVSVLLLAIAGCGEETLTKAEFVARGDAICREFDAREERLRPQHDPTSKKATPQDRAQGEKLLALYATELPNVAEKFHDLNVRDQDKALRDETARVVAGSASRFEEARRMLAGSRVAEARKSLVEALGPVERARKKLKAYGFRDCTD